MWSAVRFPLLVDLSRPEDVLNYTRNFYLNTEEGISVGVWHTLPASQWEEATGKGPEWYQETLGDDRPVIIYLHGNVGTRWDGDAAGYHVLSLDYRGFGDSTGEPSEAGLTSDALYLYHWVKQRSKDSLVCLWGHSLGTGVATNTAVKILEQGEDIFLIMHLFSWFSFDILDRIFLKILTSPLLILHAEDDHVVPYHMGQQVHTDVKVKMVSYEASRGYSHSSMYLDPNLSDVVGLCLDVHFKKVSSPEALEM
uniref:AB hydrolase-1 domain-containing protein n=1 Tax=Salarias fasciatus TaxID=181472 RepID=A0A672I1T9_SALFA